MEGTCNGRCKKDATSSRVIVSSPIGRWKLLVSLCYLSAKANKSFLSPVSNKHVIEELNLVATIMPSILDASLPNFSTFLLREVNFNSIRF